MKRILIEVDDDEYGKLVSKKLNLKLTWREVILEALDIETKPRRLGRPTKTSLDQLYKNTPWGKRETDIEYDKDGKPTMKDLYKKTPWGKQGR